MNREREDQIFLQLIARAQQARYLTSPNPMVACAIADEVGNLISEGHHEIYGGPHAEVQALRGLADRLPKGAKIYVTLEPCSHTGKTPPCSAALIKAEAREVIVGSLDPNPKVAGQGIAHLEAAGIQVRMASETIQKLCRFQNRRFFCLHEKKRPYIILKWAQSRDGFLSGPGGKRIQISCPEALEASHLWRAQEQAILIGSETALCDDSDLRCRSSNLSPEQFRQPLRILLDRRGRTASSAKIFQTASLSSSPSLLIGAIREDLPSGVDQIECNPDQNALPVLLEALWKKNILSLLVEGGPKIHQSFLEAGLWDEIRIVQSERELGAGVSAVSLGNFSQAKQYTSRFGNDICSCFYREDPMIDGDHRELLI